MPDISESGSNIITSTVGDEVRKTPLVRSEELFPWRRLPKELQVKVLQNLPRCDLDKCEMVNHEMFNLIRGNERWLNRKVVNSLTINRFSFRTRKGHFRSGFMVHVKGLQKKTFEIRNPQTRSYANRIAKQINSLSCLLRKMLRNSDVACLEIAVVHPSKKFFCSIGSAVLDSGCRVCTLSFDDVSFYSVTPFTLLRFLGEVAPTRIDFDKISKSEHVFTPEVLRFIVTRQHFTIRSSYDFYGKLIPIDDDTLAHLTATEFIIDCPNLITADGLMSFVESLTSMRRTITRGEIWTRFPLDEITFQADSNFNLRITTEKFFRKYRITFSTEEGEERENEME
ncbi:hypothetical protein GCK32_015902 [Trichostrongylus colubriformis]|uniref:F-box domain-containing protein n=1 Tax=Trichostrongylus colubriformis TaxID=6319 RepID=A0AAN8IGH2_TRICO